MTAIDSAHGSSPRLAMPIAITKHSGDTSSGNRHPTVLRIASRPERTPAEKIASAPTGSDADSPRIREDDKEPDKNRDRCEPPHLSIVGGAGA